MSNCLDPKNRWLNNTGKDASVGHETKESLEDSGANDTYWLGPYSWSLSYLSNAILDLLEIEAEKVALPWCGSTEVLILLQHPCTSSTILPELETL